MIALDSSQIQDIRHVVDEDLARKALVALLDFAVPTALYADDALFCPIKATIEALQTYIGFPLPAGKAMQIYSDMIDAGWRPNPNEWPDQADIEQEASDGDTARRSESVLGA
jgi:hypothetical protein